MAQVTYCKLCGAYIPDSHDKCLACGFPVDVPSLGCDKDKVETTTLYDNFSEDMLFSYNGYTINERGKVLAVPKDDGSLPTSTLDGTKWKFNAITSWREQHSTPKSERVELKRIEPLKDSEGHLDPYVQILLRNDTPIFDAASSNEPKQQEPKPDIDMDDLMGKTFLTVKLNGAVSTYYFGVRPEISVYPSERFGRTIGGKYIRPSESLQHVLDLHLIER